MPRNESVPRGRAGTDQITLGCITLTVHNKDLSQLIEWSCLSCKALCPNEPSENVLCSSSHGRSQCAPYIPLQITDAQIAHSRLRQHPIFFSGFAVMVENYKRNSPNCRDQVCFIRAIFSVYPFTLQNPTTPSRNTIPNRRQSSLEPAFAIASSIFYLACRDKAHIQEVQL